MARKEQNMAEQIGSFVGKGLPDFLVAHTLAAAASAETVRHLYQFSEFLDEFQQEPVAVAFDAVGLGIGLRSRFELVAQSPHELFPFRS